MPNLKQNDTGRHTFFGQMSFQLLINGLQACSCYKLWHYIALDGVRLSHSY